jgi:hypothetical protein
MPENHAKFSPSSLKRVMACAASYAHAQALAEIDLGPQKSGEAAREGTIAHAVAELALRKSVTPQSVAGKKLVLELDKKLETVIIEKDMADFVAVYVDHCRTLAMLADRRFVEQEVHVTTTVQGHETRDLLWGTADFVAISNERIDVVDLKYGGMPVEPESNPQLICYMLGALELLEPHNRPNRGALHIVQPRVSSEPRIWEIEDLEALRAEWLPRFERAMERAIDAAMLTVPVEGHYEAGEHCHFCPVIVTCEHFAKRMIDLAAAELEQIEQGGELSEDCHTRLVERWKAKGLVNRYYTLLEERLMAELRKGTEIPELKIVHSLGHRKWTLDDPGMMARFRNQGLKKADFVVQSVISPAVAEKLIKNKSFFETYTTRSTTEKLALAGDKRPAVDPGQDLEIIDVEFTPEVPAAPRASTSSSPASSPMMALIDLGESEELEALDLGELDERDELETLGDFGELVAIDLGEERDTEETEETEEIEL